MTSGSGKPSDLCLHLESITEKLRWFRASNVPLRRIIFQQSIQVVKNVDESIGERLQVDYKSNENGELARVEKKIAACNAHLNETIEGLASERGPIVWAPARKELAFLSWNEFGISTEIGSDKLTKTYRRISIPWRWRNPERGQISKWEYWKAGTCRRIRRGKAQLEFSWTFYTASQHFRSNDDFSDLF